MSSAEAENDTQVDYDGKEGEVEAEGEGEEGGFEEEYAEEEGMQRRGDGVCNEIQINV